jgi:peptidoglycan/xylan/chitin deacetylase (PgdA/CDA1 family)
MLVSVVSSLSYRSEIQVKNREIAGFAGMCFFCGAALHGTLNAQAQAGSPRPSQAASQPGTYWSDQKFLDTVNAVAVGPMLKPKSWPDGARVAVLLTFDDDTQAPLLRDGTTEPTALSASDYGAQAGTPRLLEILNRHKVPATFFVTGVDSLVHPELVPSLLKSGRNEIGIHGWVHEYPGLDSEAEEERLLDKAIARISSLTGKKPAGYRAPSWAFSPYTMDLIRKKGFVYDSSLQSSEIPYRILAHGQDSGVIELPIDWTLTETPYLGAEGHMPSPDLLFQLYKQEFDGAYKEGTVFILTLHPYLSGHRAPMQHLDDLITYMQSKSGVWFTTGEELARYAMKNGTER